MAKKKDQKKKDRERRVAQKKLAAQKRAREKSADEAQKQASTANKVMSAPAVSKAPYVASNKKTPFIHHRSGG